MFKNVEVKNMLIQREKVLFIHVQENCKFKEMRAKAEERGQELRKEVVLILKMEKNVNAKKACV